MCDELDKTVNSYVYSNDASASVFGWDFQVNAAIFLALHCINELKDIKVESEQQDIEITLDDSSKIYAQAKSAQDYSTASKNKKKIKDGLLSLARTHQNNSNGMFVYISNIPDVFSNEESIFNNDVRCYSDLPNSIKSQVDSLFDNIKSDIQKKIEENTSKPNVIEKLNYYISCIDNFDKNKLSFSVIVPYIGSDKSRYKPIIEKLMLTLSEYFSLDSFQMVGLKNKLLSFYHECFLLNASTEDEKELHKELNRNDFVWPAVALTIEQQELNPDDWSYETIDTDRLTDVYDKIDSLNIAYHERFELITKILTDYSEYKRLSSSSLEVEKKFANAYCANYVTEFDGYGFDDKMKELVTLWFLYRVVKNNGLISKIAKRL